MRRSARLGSRGGSSVRRIARTTFRREMRHDATSTVIIVMANPARSAQSTLVGSKWNGIVSAGRPGSAGPEAKAWLKPRMRPQARSRPSTAPIALATTA